jgi:hypothetical protein
MENAEEAHLTGDNREKSLLRDGRRSVQDIGSSKLLTITAS